MTKVLVDSDLRSKLLNLRQPLELCDESGRVLARVLPAFDASLYEGLDPQISRQEIERRKQNKGQSYSTAEVLAHLEQL